MPYELTDAGMKAAAEAKAKDAALMKSLSKDEFDRLMAMRQTQALEMAAARRPSVNVAHCSSSPHNGIPGHGWW